MLAMLVMLAILAIIAIIELIPIANEEITIDLLISNIIRNDNKCPTPAPSR